MAIELSKEMQDSYRFPNFLYLRLLIKLRFLRSFIHDLLCSMSCRNNKLNRVYDCAVTNSLEDSKKRFKENGWCYIENFLEESFYKQLISNWPSFYYFEPMKQLLKSYDIGFRLNRDNKKVRDSFDSNLIIKKSLDYFLSDDFRKRITEFCDDEVERSLYSFLLTQSHYSSSVIPHKDTVASMKGGESFINIVYFVSGKTGPKNGGLCILEENNFNKIIFKPENLKNTALIYRSSADFYHGFEPIRFNATRWTMNVQFCSTEYIKTQ